MKKQKIFLAAGILAFIFYGCKQTVETKVPTKDSDVEVDGTIIKLEIYDDIDKTTPLTLDGAVTNANNSTTAHAGASKLFVVAEAKYPDKTKVDISAGIISGIAQGTSAKGINFTGNTQIKISVNVPSNLELNKEYKISVLKNAADIPPELVNLENKPLGSHAVYWSGRELPYTNGEINENYGYDTFTAAMLAIEKSGSGSADSPDVIMLGRDVMIGETAVIPNGKHIKITVPPYKHYTISRKLDSGKLFEGAFFKLNYNDSSLRLEATDLPATPDGIVDSCMTLDGGAKWKTANGVESNPVSAANGGSNAGVTAAGSFIEMTGGSVTLNKWLILQNNDITDGNLNTFNYYGAVIRSISNADSVKIYDGVNIRNNKAAAGGALFLNNKDTRIYGGLFEYNLAALGGGGALLVNDAVSELTIAGGIFLGNAAPSPEASDGSLQGGGAIYDNGAKITIASPKTLAKLEFDKAVKKYPEFASLAADRDISYADWSVFPAYNKMGGTAYNDGITGKGFILFKGNSTGGGGGALRIRNNTGSYELYDAVFEDNTNDNSRTSSCGGVIQLRPATVNSAGIVIKNCYFRYNSNLRSGTFGAGALAVYSNVTGDETIENCVFEQNTATNQGGAIMDYGRGNINYAKCAFKNNKSGLNGGAMYMNNNHDANVRTITSCLFEGNEAGSTAGALRLEGSMAFIITGTGTDLPDGSTLAARYAADRSGWTVFRGNKANYGGAIDVYTTSSNPQTMNYCEIRDNEALTNEAGGIRYEPNPGTTPVVFSIGKNVIIAGNKTTKNSGGGIWQYRQTIINFNGIIGGPDAADANFAVNNGGGVYVLGDSSAATQNPVFTLGTEGVITGNGSAMINGEQKYTQCGGGIALHKRGRISIQGEISNNKASLLGGGIFQNADAGAYAPAAGQQGTVEGIIESTAKITGNSVVPRLFNPANATVNASDQSAGGGIWLYNNQNTSDTTKNYLLIKPDANGNIAEICGNSAARGAGIFAWGKVTIDMTGGAIKNNTTTTPAVPLSPFEHLLQKEWAYYGGGGVYLFGSTNVIYPVFTMNAGKISGNTAVNIPVSDGAGGITTTEGAFGGGVLLREYGQFRMPTGSTGEISGNTSQWKGGGIALMNQGANGFAMNSATAKFENNTAALYGGAIYATKTPVLTLTPALPTLTAPLTNVVVSARLAAVAGQVTYTEGQFTNNSVTGTGGLGNVVFVLTNAMNGRPSGVSGFDSRLINVPLNAATTSQTFQIFTGDAAGLNLP
ncbi:MAG: hypothetical protein LBG72_00090 [Spirochaetaceae bacterium]|jgi:predicted outer membrane repeat protein|nr:hypothetical protein [Spirochaetaceae bacterium]